MKYAVRIILACVLIVSAHTAFAATITVDTTVSPNAGDGFCTLSEALDNANANSDTSGGDCTAGQGLPTIDVIEFDIPGAGPHTIAVPLGDYFNITESVTIDGTTQSGTVCTLDGGARQLQINIDASATINDYAAFNLFDNTVDNVTIKGLAIFNNTDGVAIATWGDGTVIQCNNIGTDAEGLIAYPNRNGIVIYDNETNIARTGIVIGGPNPGDGNLISGNGFDGESFDGWGIQGGGEEMVIQGNWIGVDITGQAALGNQNAGIDFGNSSTVAYDGVQILNNVISGNGVEDDSYSPGINIGGSSETGTSEPVTNLVIKGNIIGLSADGIVDLGNQNDGIGILSRTIGATIGGVLEGERNIISGNGDHGISIAYNVHDVIIQGNYIGTDITGESALENGSMGISISDGDRAQIVTNILIGGDTEAEGNIISGNGDTGIFVDGDAVTISGNKIGTDPTGLVCIGNGNQGIQNNALTTNLLIGGDTAGERNIIGCSVNTGLYLQGPATIQGNYIGVGADGETDIATQLDDIMNIGIEIQAETVIGGDIEAEGNIIRYLNYGIKADAPTGSSLIQNNIITNNQRGVFIFGMTDNLDPVVTLIQNSITNNGLIGIDLANDSDDDNNPDGVGAGVQNINDDGDTDTGPNGYINHPVVLTTIQDGSDTTVMYGLNVPVGYYRVEFFSNPTNGIAASGYGEGEVFKGYDIVEKTMTGIESYLYEMADTDLDDDVTLTVTACDDSGCAGYAGTSEFSNTAPPGVDYGTADTAASHIIDTVYLGVCINGDSGNGENDDADGPVQVGAFLGTAPCADDRDGIAFFDGALVPTVGSFAASFTPISGDGALDDATFSGDYAGIVSGELYVLIVSTAPDNEDTVDYFIWSDGESFGDPVAITPGVPQLVRDGIYVTFASGTGHMAFDEGTFEGDVWTLTLSPGGMEPTGSEQEANYAPSSDVIISVTASAPGYVHAWLDANGDDDFTDEGEHILDNEGVSTGENGFSFTAPASDGVYNLRVRYTSYEDADLGPTSLANDGEVEDYLLTVASSSSQPEPVVTLRSSTLTGGKPVSSILGSGTCPASQIIHEFMRQGDRNGAYSSYSKGTVTEVSLLQAHINRILASQYSQAAGPVDGIFGRQTKQGVQRLQTALNAILKPAPLLKIDGIVGPFTRSAINGSCGV